MRRFGYALVLVVCSGCRTTPTTAPSSTPDAEPAPATAPETPAPSSASSTSRVPVATEPSPTIETPPGESSRHIRPTTTAPPPEATQRAREHFQSGAAAFERGDFAKAVAEFTAADDLMPKAALLFNVANAREKMGDLGGARNTYVAVLARADVDENLRDLVQQHIARLDRIISGGGPPSP